jgi:hypothetical protein
MTRILPIALAILGGLSACSGEPGPSSGSISTAYYEIVVGREEPATPATSATMSAVSTMYVFNLIGGGMAHHLEMWNPSNRALDLKPGTTYVGGPEGNGRGTVDDNLGPDGYFVTHADMTWVDVLGCTDEAWQQCESAALVAVELEAAPRDGWSRLHYRAWRSGEDVPFASGTLLTPQDPGYVIFTTPIDGQMK